MKLKVAGAQKK